jgi:Rod binding domain-containing protein
VSDITPIDAAALPADVRNGTPARKATYEGAMQFEQMLVQQLTSQLTSDAQSTSGGDDGSDDGSSTDTTGLSGPYASMLPQAMAQGIEAGGGLGLAEQITNAIDPISVTDTQSAQATAPTTPGAST